MLLNRASEGPITTNKERRGEHVPECRAPYSPSTQSDARCGHRGTRRRRPDHTHARTHSRASSSAMHVTHETMSIRMCGRTRGVRVEWHVGTHYQRAHEREVSGLSAGATDRTCVEQIKEYGSGRPHDEHLRLVTHPPKHGGGGRRGGGAVRRGAREPGDGLSVRVRG